MQVLTSQKQQFFKLGMGQRKAFGEQRQSLESRMSSRVYTPACVFVYTQAYMYVKSLRQK